MTPDTTKVAKEKLHKKDSLPTPYLTSKGSGWSAVCSRQWGW